MTREGQDGINSDAAGMDHAIPVVAYYIDSPSFTWTPAEIAMFPHSVHVRIATRWTTRDGHVIDCENGDATPAQAAQWVHQRRADGYPHPMIYTSISNQGNVIAALNAIGEPSIGDGWWLAHYDNLDVLPPGVLGKQYADPGPLDRSIWAGYIPGVDDAVTNPLTTVDGEQMLARISALSQGLATAGAGSSNAPVPSEPSIGAALKALPGQITALSAKLDAAVSTLAGDITAEQAAIIAALPAGGTVTDAQLATLTASLEAALPTYTVSIAPKTS